MHMNMRESELVQRLRLEASRLGATLFRNNTGSFKDATGRWVKFGLCHGSSDLIGWYKGRFVAIEAKTPGNKPRSDQANFISSVIKAGGIAGVAYSVEDLKKILDESSQPVGE